MAEVTEGSGGLPAGLERLPAVLQPDRRLMTYFALTALLAGPGFPVLLVILYFKYHTLRYEVDEEGITARWGILFRREVSLTFARIQDIHLTSNVVERWLGLARIQIQTASGSSSAELTIEGVRAYQAMRDFLYTRMRGARAHAPATASPGTASASDRAPASAPAGSPAAALAGEGVAREDALAAVLDEVAAELRALRQALPTTAGGEHG